LAAIVKGGGMTELKSVAFVDRIIEKFGGKGALLDAMDRRMKEFSAVWGQDTDRIGRVLRAHLAVEHFVGVSLVTQSPGLAGLERARLSYAQKIELLDRNSRIVEELIPGLRLLGTIRNRIAHRLRVDLTEEERKAFLGGGLFRAMRDASIARNYAATDDDVLTILEQFARFAAGMLHSSADPQAEIWKSAFEAIGGQDKAAEARVTFDNQHVSNLPNAPRGESNPRSRSAEARISCCRHLHSPPAAQTRQNLFLAPNVPIYM
jgi:hypothetical protein